MKKENENYLFWKNIWNEKGRKKEIDIFSDSGYEHMSEQYFRKGVLGSEYLGRGIFELSNMKVDDIILEIGCSVGHLAEYFSNEMCMDYVGIDYSKSLLEKHRRLRGNVVFQCDANNLFFPNKSFDVSFCFGVLQYFPDLNYFEQVEKEMIRVSKRGIFLGDIKTDGSDRHMKYSKQYFVDKGYKISDCIYDKKLENRFNAFLNIG